MNSCLMTLNGCLMTLNGLILERAVTFMKYLANIVSLIFLPETLM